MGAAFFPARRGASTSQLERVFPDAKASGLEQLKVIISVIQGNYRIFLLHTFALCGLLWFWILRLGGQEHPRSNTFLFWAGHRLLVAGQKKTRPFFGGSTNKPHGRMAKAPAPFSEPVWGFGIEGFWVDALIHLMWSISKCPQTSRGDPKHLDQATGLVCSVSVTHKFCDRWLSGSLVLSRKLALAS